MEKIHKNNEKLKTEAKRQALPTDLALSLRGMNKALMQEKIESFDPRKGRDFRVEKQEV